MGSDEKGRQILHKGHNPTQNRYAVENVLSQVHEEHVYLISKTQDGNELIWEADLLGDQTPDGGHGKLPPIIHIECPFCTDPTVPDGRKAVSVDFKNKPYEIEPLRQPDVKQVSGPMGRSEVVIRHHLHVRDILGCPYCTAKFTIRGGRIERVG
jgi:hypothetical protein